MLGALVLCSPSEHVFCYTLLTLWCTCVNEWNVLHEAREEPCSVVLRWPHTAYGRNLSGVYTDLPMPRGTQCPKRLARAEMGKACGPNFPFSVKLFGLFDHFITPWEIEVLTLSVRLVDLQGTCDLCCYCVLWLRSQIWIGNQEALSLTRHRKFGRQIEL